MRYKQGDLVFSMNNGHWISRTMAWFMRSKFSHTFVIAEVTPDYVYTTETSDFETTIGIIDKYVNDQYRGFEVWRHRSMTDQERKHIVDVCYTHLNETYGYLQLFSFAIKRIFKNYFKKDIKNFIRQGIVCNGHALTGYTQSPTCFKNIDPESIDPQEMYEMMILSGEFELIYKKEANY